MEKVSTSHPKLNPDVIKKHHKNLENFRHWQQEIAAIGFSEIVFVFILREFYDKAI
jgi:hypothetical protein